LDKCIVFRALRDFRLIAFTHQNASIEEIGMFHIDPQFRAERLSNLKTSLEIGELFYLSTCNRVEFLFRTHETLNEAYSFRFLKSLFPGWSNGQLEKYSKIALLLEGESAARHLFSVAASIDSLVVGEREIISQVKAAYNFSAAEKLSGDGIRLLTRKVIEAAKEVFTATPISKNPVSIVSLAYRSLKSMHVHKNARILIIGAGETNTNLTKYLKKHGFRNFTIFNRSLENAKKLAKQIDGKAFNLSELSEYSEGFDVLVSCTSSSTTLIGPELYRKLLNQETGKKVVIDLAVPSDVDPLVYSLFSVESIHIESLRGKAMENMSLRRGALDQCEKIIDHHFNEYRSMSRHRKVEVAMKDVPRMVKEIREFAVQKVFASDLDKMDEKSREVVDRMLSYLEKKYISVPMKLAKEIMLDDPS
jgi:glutamyl-tRNA reductase